MASDNATNSAARKRRVENIIVVWFDDSSDQNTEAKRQSVELLHRIVNDVHMFTDSDSCVCFITTLVNERAFLIVNDAIGQQMVPLIHNVIQIDSIYIYDDDSMLNTNWIESFRKVRGVFSSMPSLCERLPIDQHFIENRLIQFQIMSPSSSSLSTMTEKNANKNKQNAAFMLAQLVQEIILRTTDNNKQEMVDYCLVQFHENPFVLRLIEEYDHDYVSTKAIWWYTLKKISE